MDRDPLEPKTKGSPLHVPTGENFAKYIHRRYVAELPKIETLPEGVTGVVVGGHLYEVVDGEWRMR